MRRVSRAGPVSQMTAPPLTEAVRALLNKAGFKDAPSTEAQLSVPLLILETLAAKVCSFCGLEERRANLGRWLRLSE